MYLGGWLLGRLLRATKQVLDAIDTRCADYYARMDRPDD